MTEKAKKWDDNAVEQLLSIAGNESPVSVSAVEKAGEVAGFSIAWEGSGVNEVGIDRVSGKTMAAITCSVEPRQEE